MRNRDVIWTPAVKDKLLEFRSKRFTPEETLDFISQFILETEDLLKNPVLRKTYTEEFGKYKEFRELSLRSSKYILNQ